MMLMSACPESDLSSALPFIHAALELPASVVKTKKENLPCVLHN